MIWRNIVPYGELCMLEYHDQLYATCDHGLNDDCACRKSVRCGGGESVLRVCGGVASTSHDDGMYNTWAW